MHFSFWLPVLLQLSCGGERQEAILSAAKVRQAGESNGKEATGGGAMLLCIAGSSHNTFAGVRGGGG